MLDKIRNKSYEIINERNEYLESFSNVKDYLKDKVHYQPVSMVWKSSWRKFYEEENPEFNPLKIDIIDQLITIYISSMTDLNRYELFPPTRVSFCDMINISSELYDNFLNGQDAILRDSLSKVEDYIIDTLQHLGLTKQINDRTLGRLLQTVGNRGHSQMTTSTIALSGATKNKTLNTSPEEIAKAISAVTLEINALNKKAD